LETGVVAEGPVQLVVYLGPVQVLLRAHYLHQANSNSSDTGL
jgi:hypothetical protein